MKRRNFVKCTPLAGMGLWAGCKVSVIKAQFETSEPTLISTWNHGIPANKKGWSIIEAGGTALDAVEQGVMVVEADPDSRSVGLGGLPDREGKVTLDACIMNHLGNAGSVVFLQDIVHAISVARQVMENTPHVILAGKGAKQFAIERGFKPTNLLTEKSKADWEMWLKKSLYHPVINVENHDTIGMLGLDQSGNLSGACTTSGVAYKMHGRVGDSPIIGSGLFVDNEVGAAAATGMGEEVIKTVGSFLIIELMRQGHSPQEACEEAVRRIVKDKKNVPFQVGYLAIDKVGNYGAYAIHEGFNFSLTQKGKTRLMDAKSHF